MIRNENEKKATCQVSCNRYRDTCEMLPMLGFGAMRLPEKNGKIDRAAAQNMVDRAMACGVHYFDTAYMYHNGESETFLGEALAKYPRESFYLTDKMPILLLESEADNERIFDEQLRRTRVEYFDFYFMHWLNEPHWEMAKRFRTWEFMQRMQEKGKIRRLGFSFHGESAKLKEIAETYPWDLVQIQLNYLDWEACHAREQYEILTELGIPVAVMEPLKGGTLTRLNDEIRGIFRRANPDAGLASWGLRYVASLPNVLVTLSGMSSQEQVEENIRTFMPFVPLTDAEQATVSEALAVYRRSIPIPCTSCHYCIPCPAGVDIPRNLAIANQLKAITHPSEKLTVRNNYVTIPQEEQATSCVNCGICQTRCPQQLEIPKHLRALTEGLEGWEEALPVRPVVEGS